MIVLTKIITICMVLLGQKKCIFWLIVPVFQAEFSKKKETGYAPFIYSTHAQNPTSFLSVPFWYGKIIFWLHHYPLPPLYTDFIDGLLQ